MSWNGATGIASWRINGDVRFAKSGFETLNVLSGLVAEVRAAALDAKGMRIGRSATVMISGST